jgi:uncharacterized protein YdhG (YjbR/CyaY superfamily)
MTDSKKPTQGPAFSDDERAAMKERAAEVKRAKRRGPQSAADGEHEVRAKIAEMAEADRALAERIHAIVMASAPDLTPRTWYGMPAYARDGKLICFFQPAGKFKARYATLGFDENAHLDEGTMWPTAYALTELTAADEARISELVRKALG